MQLRAKLFLAVALTLGSIAGLALDAVQNQRQNVPTGWIKSMGPDGKTAAGLLVIPDDRRGDTDRITGISSPVAANVELVETVAASSSVPPEEAHTGVPESMIGASSETGRFVMLSGMRKPLQEGQEVAVKLTFEKRGTVEVILPVVGSGGETRNAKRDGSHPGF